MTNHKVNSFHIYRQGLQIEPFLHLIPCWRFFRFKTINK